MALGFFVATLLSLKQCIQNSEQKLFPTHHSSVLTDYRHFQSCRLLKTSPPSHVSFLKQLLKDMHHGNQEISQERRKYGVQERGALAQQRRKRNLQDGGKARAQMIAKQQVRGRALQTGNSLGVFHGSEHAERGSRQMVKFWVKLVKTIENQKKKKKKK